MVDVTTGAQPKSPQRGRDIKGRFIKGNRHSKGNAGGRPMNYAADYMERMRERLTLDEWDAVISKAIEQAKDGDNRARTWLASYVMGQPVQQVIADVSGTRDRLLQVLGMIEESLPEVGEGGT